MTEAEVITYVTFQACASTDPVLSAEDVEFIVGINQRSDGTWDIPGAVAEAWTQKAGRCAERYMFTSEGNLMLQRQQVMDHCNKMATQWRKRRRNSISTLDAELALTSEV